MIPLQVSGQFLIIILVVIVIVLVLTPIAIFSVEPILRKRLRTALCTFGGLRVRILRTRRLGYRSTTIGRSWVGTAVRH